jgi:hypothetical protein
MTLFPMPGVLQRAVFFIMETAFGNRVEGVRRPQRQSLVGHKRTLRAFTQMQTKVRNPKCGGIVGEKMKKHKRIRAKRVEYLS